MYGSVVLGVDHHYFEEIIEHAKMRTGVIEDTALTVDDWRKVVAAYKDLDARGDQNPVSDRSA